MWNRENLYRRVKEDLSMNNNYNLTESITIKTSTWQRDSHGLFDYESKTLTRKSLKTSAPGKISRDGNDIILSKETEDSKSKGISDLIKFAVRDGNFWIHSPLENHKNNSTEEVWDSVDQGIWLVVKSFRPNSENRTVHKHHETYGDFIKLGRVKFRVRELRSSPAISSSRSVNKNDRGTKIEDDQPSIDESTHKKSVMVGSLKDVSGNNAFACRICLTEDPEPGNPFVTPCQCAGTMRYIHVKCLQRWLKSKLHIKPNGHSTTILWKNLDCELCKNPFPSSVEVENKKYDLIEIEKPDSAYIILDILAKEKNTIKGVHVVKMEGKTNIRLGRGHDSDIRITDISVSRCHALIKLDKGNFYIEDNSSKFGTLVYIKKPLSVSGDFNNVSFQVGRTVIAVTVKKGWSLLPSCFGGQNENVNTSGDDRSDSEDVMSDNEVENPNRASVANRPTSVGLRNNPPNRNILSSGDQEIDENHSDESEHDNEEENDNEGEQRPEQGQQPRPNDDSGSEPQDHEIPNENGANSFARNNRA